ncbi:haptoglobin [Labrus bergylta]|uniref:haptoglobin n=1 Tax=Labrus bergylta TaxID=56723 RepID=UPI00331389F2
MWFSLTVLLLASCCLADVTGEMMKQTDSRFGSFRSRRMIGGSLAPHVPWQAMIYLSDSVLDGGYAGGALISDRWILTAGRNLFVRKTRQDTQGKDPEIPKVYLGISGRVEAVESKQVAVQKIVLHPGFQNHTDWENDLALIQLKEPVVMSDKVTPIPLPERNQDPRGAGIITGWGWGTQFAFVSSLKHLVLPPADHAVCKRHYGDELTVAVDDNMFCTGPAEFQHNVCFGDSGGALVFQDDDTKDIYAAGILSYDKPCSNKPYGVYMKISAYLPWIHSVIRGDTERSADLRSDVMSKLSSW